MGLKKNNPGCGCCGEECECNYCIGDVMPCRMQLEISGITDNDCPEEDCYKHNGTYILSHSDACYFKYVRDDSICGKSQWEYRLWLGPVDISYAEWGIEVQINSANNYYALYQKILSETQPFDCDGHDGVVIPWQYNYILDDCYFENATIKVTSGDLL